MAHSLTFPIMNARQKLGAKRTHVKMHSLFLPVDGRLEHGCAGQLEHGCAGQLEHGCWQAAMNMVVLVSLNMVADRLPWTWLCWPAWTCLLTGWAALNMVELASLNTVVDRHVHACCNSLFMAWWTNRLEQRCWNHHDKSTAMFIHDRACCQGMMK